MERRRSLLHTRRLARGPTAQHPLAAHANRQSRQPSTLQPEALAADLRLKSGELSRMELCKGLRSEVPCPVASRTQSDPPAHRACLSRTQSDSISSECPDTST